MQPGTYIETHVVHPDSMPELPTQGDYEFMLAGVVTTPKSAPLWNAVYCRVGHIFDQRRHLQAFNASAPSPRMPFVFMKLNVVDLDMAT